MDDTELDQVISSISMELKRHDYTSRTVETEKEMQFEFNDPESGDYAELYGKKIHEQKVFVFHTINEQISNFAQTYPTNLKASSNEALLFMRRYRFANCSCFSCCFKDAYPSSNVQ